METRRCYKSVKILIQNKSVFKISGEWLILCVNLTEPPEAWVFSQTLFWVYLDEIII